MKKEVNKFIRFHFSDEEINTIKKTLEIFEDVYTTMNNEKLYEKMIDSTYSGLIEIVNKLNLVDCITIEG